MRSGPSSPSSPSDGKTNEPDGVVRKAEDPSTGSDRVRRWLLTYGPHAETLLAASIVAIAAVTVVVVLLGAVTALPTGPQPEVGVGGSTDTGGILGLGTTLINGSILMTLVLGFLVVCRGAVELRTALRSGNESGREGDTGASLAYVGLRALQTAAAVAFVGPILAGVTLSRTGVIGADPPNSLILFLLVGGLVLLGSVLAHPFVRLVRSTATA